MHKIKKKMSDHDGKKKHFLKKKSMKIYFNLTVSVNTRKFKNKRGRNDPSEREHACRHITYA
jgi:hypothetical protein